MNLSIDQILQEAISAQTTDRWQEAEALYRTILQVEPKHPYANHNLGVMEFAMGEYDKALELFKIAHQVNPDHGQFRVSYIDCLLKKKEYKNAIKILNEGIGTSLSKLDYDALKQRLPSVLPAEQSEKREKTKFSNFPGYQMITSKNIYSINNRINSVMQEVPREPSTADVAVLLEHYQQARYMAAEEMARAMTLRFPNHQFGWKVLGATLKLAKRFQDALIADVKSVELMATDSDAHSNLGITLLALGRLDASETSCNRAIELAPNSAFNHFNLANTLLALGRTDAAAASYKTAIAMQPDHAPSHSNLGNALRKLDRLEEAEASYREAITLMPELVETHNNLGCILRELGNSIEAESCFRRALELAPDYAEARHNFAKLLMHTDRFEEASHNFNLITQVKPDHVEAHCLLASILIELGRFPEAQESCRLALEIDADNVSALECLARSFYLTEIFDKAEKCYRKLLLIQPDNAINILSLAATLTLQNRHEEARVCYRNCQQLGHPAGSLREAFMLPAIMGTKQEVLDSRSIFLQKLEQLIEGGVPIDEPVISAGFTNFYLAFHGLNDRDLQVKIAKYYEQVCPSLLFTAPHCKQLRQSSRKKIRLGILSEFLNKHSISICFSMLIEDLSWREEFDVVLISSSKIDEEIYEKANARRMLLSSDLNIARAAIADMELDLIIYLDIGMSPFSYFLAFSRLAPVQCVLSGHPVTTGISNMDYFISWASGEPDNAEIHYSEKLVKLLRPLVYFKRPNMPSNLKTRQELGLPPDINIYICPMALQKLHPDFDEAIARILQIDNEGVAILFEDSKRPAWAIDIKNRFERTIPSTVRSRILFRPWIKTEEELISTIAAADVVLDPFHFGIGTTAAYTTAAGTPMVTKVGEFFRGRVGDTFCKMLDVEECSAKDMESYCQKAVNIANDGILQASIRSKILINNHVLFEDIGAIDDLVDFLINT